MKELTTVQSEKYSVKVRTDSLEYENKIRDLEKKSVDALRRLEAHMRSRELELKEKQDEELTHMKESLIDVMKEKENGIYKRKNEIEMQEKRLQVHSF